MLRLRVQASVSYLGWSVELSCMRAAIQGKPLEGVMYPVRERGGWREGGREEGREGEKEREGERV